MADGIGRDYRMPDADQRLLGTLPFVLDRRAAGMVHAKVVRSLQPHATIRGIDASEALAMPGVLAVLTGRQIANDPGIEPYFGAMRVDQPVLAIDKARYAGDPVAIVIAEKPQQAAAAAPFVDVDYEDLPHVVDADDAATPGAPVIHEDWPDNNCGSWRSRLGDCDAALQGADHVFTGVYYSPPASHVPMEPYICLADWTGNELEVWTSTQAPHAVRQGLEKMFSLPEDRVRVRTLNLGGAYGAKGQVKIEPMAACAARAVGRPVRMELSRDEVFLTIGKHAARVELTTGVNRDGRFVARRAKVNYNAGAYAVTSVGASGQGLTRANGPYAIPNIAVDSVATYTNTVPSGPFRGAMTSQLAFAHEQQIDEIADALGTDPVELRRLNLLRDGDVYATGEALHDLHYDELLDDLVDAIGWGTPSEPASPGKVRGKGLAIMLKNTLTPSRSEARLRACPDGTVHVFSSSVEMGQGAHATILQLVSEYLGISIDRLVMGFPDTRHTPFDTTTSSSRTTSSMGEAVRKAAADLMLQLRSLAAKRWQASEDDVEISAGSVRLRRGDEPREQPWEELIEQAEVPDVTGHGVIESDFGLALMDDPHDVKGPVSVHWHQGGAAAEVEVDLETGRLEVLRMHANCFAGKVVNPLRVRQQNQGCVIFGLGPTLFEELDYQDGTLTNPNLSDYMIPSILDVPATITSTAVESDDPGAELHGVGEMALPAVSPAVANALFAATGVRLHELPLTPERILHALEQNGRNQQE
ncbi:MAG: molybdopterin-dependent oxidoreductase [Propionibacteriales bacterium]|nr:molybdopterin-dependent oxidoreductase [Propionibacteriales bacterium]